MTGWLRPAICVATALLVTLVCGLSPRRATFAAHAMVPLGDVSYADRDIVLPAGFSATVDRETSDRFVRVVAGDVDRDGDIDVVASVGSLDLIVWKNDGAGHFTRVPSSHRDVLQTQPAAPLVDGDPLASYEWIQNGQPRGADIQSLRARTDRGPELSFTTIVGTAAGRYGPRVRSSRAPPNA